VLALAASFLPFVVVLGLVTALALAIGSLVAGRPSGAGRMLAVGVGATLTAGVLHLPWTWDLVGPEARWDVFAGISSTDGGDLSAASLLRFETGPHGGVLGYALLIAAALPMLIGRGWRFEWAVRAWFVALAAWGLTWAGQEGWFPGRLPPPEVLIAAAGAGLALATALGMAAFEVDLPGYRFGWRQAVSSAAALAVLVGILPLASGIADGRWKMPGGDLDRPMGLVLDQADQPPGRVLWVGDPELVPAGGFRYDDRLTVATTEGLPTLEGRWGAPEAVSADLPGDALRLAVERRTSRLGALLAPMGVQFVVVPNRNAPSAYSGVSRPPPEVLLSALAEQLDLAPIESDVSLTVYGNTAYRGMVTIPPDGTSLGDRFTDAATDDVADFVAADLDRADRTTWEGRTDARGPLLLAERASPGWRLEAGSGDSEGSTAYGWAQRFTVADTGDTHLSHRSSSWYTLLLGAQILLWLAAIVWVRRTSPRRGVRRSTRARQPAVGPVEVPS
jgi:hypothetical protein